MPLARRTIASPISTRRIRMRRRHPRQLPMRFDGDAPEVSLPTQTAQELVKALADLLLATGIQLRAGGERSDRPVRQLQCRVIRRWAAARVALSPQAPQPPQACVWPA